MTAAGHRLARIYNDNDLLAAEALRTGLWRDLDPAELAAVCSTLVFEGRAAEEPAAPKMPNSKVASVIRDQSDTRGSENPSSVSTGCPSSANST